MKKTAVSAALVIFLCLTACSAFAELSDALTEVSGWLHLNGKVFDEHVATTVPDSWIIGILDALRYLQGAEMDRLYPKGNNVAIVKAVKLYYTQNPLKKSRPIVEVILAGCK